MVHKQILLVMCTLHCEPASLKNIIYSHMCYTCALGAWFGCVLHRDSGRILYMCYGFARFQSQEAVLVRCGI